MFGPGLLYGGYYENRKYMHHFWHRLHDPYNLYLIDPLTFDPAAYYDSGTSRRSIEIPPDVINDMTEAMRIAQRAFLELGLMLSVRCNVDTQLRSALVRIGGYLGPGSVPRDIASLADAVLDCVRRGKLIHLPKREELHASVKAIQQDRQKRPTPISQQPVRFDPRAAAQQMMGKPPRMPGGLNTSLRDAQPFDYQPDTPDGDAEQLAASTNNPDYAAEMLGYDRDTFGKMIHVMKDANELRGDDNVVWHDNGDVFFRGNLIDNMHNY